MNVTGSGIALGFFDGVHTAHQKIIREAVRYSKENNLCAMALSFDRSPLELLSPEKVNYLTTKEEKEEIISSLGAKTEFLTLSCDLINMTAEDFIKEILVKKYNIKYAVCGYNYRFGKGGKGDIDLLARYGEKYGFTVRVFDRETKCGESISSSRIRKLIAEGSIEEANELLGRNFSIGGKVCEGKKLGRTLGFPTANVFWDNCKVVPKNGVYKTRVTAESQKYESITNIGTNPTVGGERLRAETFLSSFSGNLYEKEIKVEFLQFIRAEKEFSDINELKIQIEKDISNL